MATQASEVTYRPIQWNDIDAIVDEFDNTWGTQSPTGNSPYSLLMSRHFVLHYLEPTTRGEVAELDGEFMGVTLGRVVGEPALFPQACSAMQQSDALLASSHAGAKALNLAQRWHSVETTMESDIGINDATQGELELFLVAGRARGHGVGGRLWRSAMDYFASRAVTRFYLHTDTGCDVSFYDGHGLERVCERLASDHPEDRETANTQVTDVQATHVRTTNTPVSKAQSTGARPRNPGTATLQVANAETTGTQTAGVESFGESLDDLFIYAGNPTRVRLGHHQEPQKTRKGSNE